MSKVKAAADRREGEERGFSHRAALLFVVFVDSFSFGVIIPVVPFFILAHGAGPVAGGALVGVHALCSIVASPVLGRLSDRFGRRALLIVTLSGTAVSYLVFASATTLWQLALARALGGLMAGNLGIVQAAVADTSSAKQRAKALSQVAAFWALGYVVGPSASDLLVTLGSPVVGPGLAAAGLAGAALAASLMWIPAAAATRVEAATRPSARAARPLHVAWPVLALLASAVLVSVCQNGVIAITPYWAHRVLNWTQWDVGLLTTWVALGSVATQLAISPAVFRWFGILQAFTGSLAVTVVGCAVVLAMRSNLGLVLGVPLVMSGLSLGATGLNTAISHAARAQDQGRAMGFAVGAAAVGRIAGPSLLALSYASLGPSSYLVWIGVIAAGLTLGWPVARLGSARLSRSRAIVPEGARPEAP